MKITSLYLHLNSGHAIRVDPADEMWINKIPVTIEELPDLLARPDVVFMHRTKAQEAQSEEEYEAIMEADENEPWVRAKLPPVYVAYDTIYGRSVACVVVVTDEEVPDA